MARNEKDIAANVDRPFDDLFVRRREVDHQLNGRAGQQAPLFEPLESGAAQVCSPSWWRPGVRDHGNRPERFKDRTPRANRVGYAGTRAPSILHPASDCSRGTDGPQCAARARLACAILANENGGVSRPDRGCPPTREATIRAHFGSAPTKFLGIFLIAGRAVCVSLLVWRCARVRHQRQPPEREPTLRGLTPPARNRNWRRPVSRVLADQHVCLPMVRPFRSMGPDSGHFFSARAA